MRRLTVSVVASKSPWSLVLTLFDQEILSRKVDDMTHASDDMSAIDMISLLFFKSGCKVTRT
jgi:hypothetical protein